MGFLNPPYLGKSIIKKDNGSNPLYPSSYKSPYLTPTFSTTRMLKELFGKAIKCKNKINKKKEENIGQNKDKHRMGDVPSLPLLIFYLKLKSSRKVCL